MPTDGVVVQGESFVDEAMVTGEPAPVWKRPGSAMIGGTVASGRSALLMRATHVGSETVLSQVWEGCGASADAAGCCNRVEFTILVFASPLMHQMQHTCALPCHSPHRALPPHHPALQIVRLVQSAQMSKAPVQAFADRVSAVFVPVVVALSFITWFTW